MGRRGRASGLVGGRCAGSGHENEHQDDEDLGEPTGTV